MGIEMVVNLLVLVVVGTLAGEDWQVEGRFRASLRRLWGGWGAEWLDTFEDIYCMWKRALEVVFPVRSC